jgi:integrase
MAARMEKTRFPGIFKRGSRYVVPYRDEQGRQRKPSFRVLEDSRRAKGRIDSGQRAGVDLSPFDEYATDWLDSYGGRTSRGLSPRTKRAYRRSLENRLLPFFGRKAIGKIQPRDVRRLIAALEAEGLTPSTIRNDLAPLRAMFATALEDGDVPRNPTVGVRVNGRDDDGEDKPRALTRVELAALLAEVPEEWRLFFEFLTHTGLRISEAIGLEWGAVEFGERPRVLVRWQNVRGERSRPKSANGDRPIPLSPVMARRLWRLRGTQPSDALVFPSHVGTPLNDGNMRRRVLKPAGVRAGLLRPRETWKNADQPESWVGFHTFRHTCASLLFAAGKNVKQVQEWLGHADPGFTLRTYVHLMDDGLGETAFLDALTAPGGNGVATQAPETDRNEATAETAIPA